MSLIIPANTLASGGFSVDNSLRFNDGSSDKLARTPSSNGSFVINTWSFWVKRSSLGADQNLFNAYVSGSNKFRIRFSSNNTLQVGYFTGSWDFLIDTNRVFRDVSAFYNIVIVQNAGDNTSTDRLQVWVNGVRETSFATTTFPDQDEGSNVINSTSATQNIGASGANNAYFDGYMAEIVHIDGTAYSADSFGEFDEDSGIWKPISVSGLTFGTNGFYLQFKESGTSANSSGIGADTSGKDNHLTVTNLTAIDQTTDTCTNNFATLNPLDVNPSSAGDVFTEGNLKLVTNNNSNAAGTRSTIAVSSGKWYAEVKYTSATAWNGVAAMDVNFHTSSMGAGTISWYQGRTLYVDGSNTANWGSAVSAGDIVGIALDMDNNKVTISQGGQWWDTDAFDAAAPTTYQNLTSGYDTWGFMCRSGSAASTSEWNFGNAPYAISSGNADGDGFGNFEYAVPSGYYSLCTKNLAEYG